MTVKVLGACCKKSLATFDNVKKAVEELGLGIEVENIGDVGKIAEYGVMSTPALVIDGKVMSLGRFLEVKDVKAIFAKILS